MKTFEKEKISWKYRHRWRNVVRNARSWGAKGAFTSFARTRNI